MAGRPRIGLGSTPDQRHRRLLAPRSPDAATAAERGGTRGRRGADAERIRLDAQRAAQAQERWLWGGRRPSARLRDLGGNVVGVARSDRELLDAFEALDAGTQRAAARWLARRAFEIAGLDRLDWVRPALDAMDRGAEVVGRFTPYHLGMRDVV